MSDESTRCGKCTHPFDEADTSFAGAARHRDSPFCRMCVDACHDSEIADHWCVIDHWRQQMWQERNA